jgi:uncharacterized protein YlaI
MICGNCGYDLGRIRPSDERHTIDDRSSTVPLTAKTIRTSKICPKCEHKTTMYRLRTGNVSYYTSKKKCGAVKRLWN